MLSGGQLGEGGSCVGPRVDLPVHRYLLLRHKGAPCESRREEKPGGEWVSSSSTEKKTSVYSPWPLCHPWILFTPREVLSPIEPPRHGPPSLPRTLATFIGTLLVLCDLPHPFIPPLFLRAKSREMLREHCKLITAPNIYYKTAGGLHGRDASTRKRRWGEAFIITITHFVSQVNVNQLISHPRTRFRLLLHLREAKR